MGRGQDHSIGPVGGQQGSVNGRLHIDQAGHRSTPNEDVIKGVIATPVSELHLKHSPLVNPALSAEVLGQPVASFIGPQLSHETEPSQIDPHDGHGIREGSACRPQDGPIATYAEEQVGALNLTSCLLLLPRRTKPYGSID
jgi:hypothetical protein